MTALQFQPLASQPTPSFWSALNTLKLDKLKLDDTQQTISGWLEEGRDFVDREATTGGTKNGLIGVDGVLSVGGGAFGDDGESLPAAAKQIAGIFKNFNTIEDFKATESKKALFDSVVDSIIASFETPSPVLNPFLLVTFADLKKYVYHYWFAFPALVAKPAWELEADGLHPLDAEDVAEIRSLEEDLLAKDYAPSEGFLVKGHRGQRVAAPMSDASSFFAETPDSERAVAFHDPSSLPSNPGWPLRNILYYLSHRHRISRVNIICLRAGSATRTGFISVPSAAKSLIGGVDRPQAVGWERNKAGKLASRVADLGPMMDPARLADQAVDLNLKLMRWRIMPALDLDRISSTKCLLLGAGTLGCYVARALMGWGIRTITFVDSAKVSYSNPVRQPLFDFEDCLDGGKPKAQCAADRLKKIFPGVVSTSTFQSSASLIEFAMAHQQNASAHSFLIPMPGHPVTTSSESATETDVTNLEELIRSHDAVFLLMDSRESRWLPTVIAAAEGKIVINAALGFDSYLVMRHGAPPGQETGRRLGCYYCNDIVAPTDSLTDRTLDQMCTVTRPGIAPIAAASAVELLVSLVQHPLGLAAPAETASGPNDPPKPESEPASPLGLVPHQLRAQLSQWRTMLIEGAAYERCTGCSDLLTYEVIDAYKSQGFPFLLRAFNETDFLEKHTGLDKLHAESEAMLEAVEWEEGSEGSF